MKAERKWYNNPKEYDDVVLSKPGDVGHRSKVFFINNLEEILHESCHLINFI